MDNNDDKEMIFQHTVCYTREELKAIVNTLKPHEFDENVNSLNGIPMFKNMNNDSLPGEIFRPYPKNNRIEASNLGRIKIDNKVVEQHDCYDGNKGYLYVKTTIVDYPIVYRFVAETWCQCPNVFLEGWQVHHISNNGYDNRPSNLMWLRKRWHGF